MNSMKEVQEAVNKVLNKKPPKKKKQSEIFETQKPKKLKGKPKEKKMPKPVGKPRKELTKGQKELMKEHKEHHTAKHMTMMRKLMKEGYCFQQAHDITMKKIGK